MSRAMQQPSPPPAADPVPLRVLYLNDALTRFGPGPAVHGMAVVRGLRALGDEVRVFPSPRDGGPGRPRRPALGSARDLLPARLPKEALDFASGLARTLRRAWQISRLRLDPAPDVIVARQLRYDWTPLLAASILGRPLVLEVNAPAHLEARLSGSGPPGLLRWIEVMQWRRATRVQVVSRELARIVQEHGIPPHRIAVVPNGADPRDEPRPIRRGSRAVRVLFVGSFYPWHGVPLLVEAFALARRRCPELELVLIGSGPDLAGVTERIRSLGLEEVVDMPGRLQRDAIDEHLADADIAVAPYPWIDRFYFSPLKVFEYMAAGLPVVASGQGQLEELIEDEETGVLVRPGDVRDLARGIADLAADPSLRHRIGDAARASIAREYTWAHAARRLHAVCEGAIEAAGRSPRAFGGKSRGGV